MSAPHVVQAKPNQTKTIRAQAKPSQAIVCKFKCELFAVTAVSVSHTLPIDIREEYDCDYDCSIQDYKMCLPNTYVNNGDSILNRPKFCCGSNNVGFEIGVQICCANIIFDPKLRKANILAR